MRRQASLTSRWRWWTTWRFISPTCWCEVLTPPAAAFQGPWSSPPPPSAARAPPRWPAETPGWLRFAGISPVGVCQGSKNSSVSGYSFFFFQTQSCDVWDRLGVRHSLALFGLKQTSLDEICNRLHEKKKTITFTNEQKAASTEQQSLTGVVLPCSSSAAASGQWGVGWRCTGKMYVRGRSREFLELPVW